MSSTVAIVFFLGIISIAFAIEARGRSDVTRAAWLPLFWLVICASRSISQWLNLSGSTLDSGQGASIDPNLTGSPVDRLVLTIAIAWGIMVLYKRREAAAELLKRNKALLAFMFYLGITVLWSDMSQVSFRRWVRLAGNLVMAAVLMTEPEPLESIRSVFRRSAYLLIPLSIMLVKYFPSMGILYTPLGGKMWIGAALMKNSLAFLCFVMTFFLIWDTLRTSGKKDYARVVLDMTALVMSLWLLRGSGEAYRSTAIGWLIVGIAMLVVLRVPTSRWNFGKLGVLAMVATCLFLVLEFSLGIIESIVTAFGRNMSLTDRVPLWNTLLALGFERVFWGYGYGGFWTQERRAYIEEKASSFTQGHSGYLEIFVEGGLVAIILLGVLLVSVLRKIQRSRFSNYDYAIFRVSLFAMILLANVTESSFARERDLLTFVFFIIALNDAKSNNVVSRQIRQ